MGTIRAGGSPLRVSAYVRYKSAGTCVTDERALQAAVEVAQVFGTQKYFGLADRGICQHPVEDHGCPTHRDDEHQPEITPARPAPPQQ